MQKLRLKLVISAISLLAASACALEPLGTNDEGATSDALPANLGEHPGLDRASLAAAEAEGASAQPAKLIGQERPLSRRESIAGPTPDPWHGAGPQGEPVSGPTPDPWSPGQGSEGDGRSGSSTPDQGSSPSGTNGTKPKG